MTLGNFNDGNLARRLYGEFADVFSEVTGVPISIIRGYWILYICLSSRRLDIDPEKFEVFADLLQEEWEANFPWYPWCVSMHHWAYHAGEIMRILPPTICVAMISEVSLTYTDTCSFRIQNYLYFINEIFFDIIKLLHTVAH